MVIVFYTSFMRSVWGRAKEVFFPVCVCLLSYSLHMKQVLQEGLGVLTGLALAPDGQSFILMKENVELLQMKPGCTPSLIW